MLGEEALLILLMKPEDIEEVAQTLEDFGYLERSAAPGIDYIIHEGGRIMIIKASGDILEGLRRMNINPILVKAKNGEFILAWNDLKNDCGLRNLRVKEVAGGLVGEGRFRIVLASDLCLAKCQAHSDVDNTRVGVIQVKNDEFLICLIENGTYREFRTSAGEVGRLNLPGNVAREVVRLINMAREVVLACIERRDDECLKRLVLVSTSQSIQLLVRSGGKDRLIAQLPLGIRIVHQASQYIAELGGITIRARSYGELARRLKANGLLIGRLGWEVETMLKHLTTGASSTSLDFLVHAMLDYAGERGFSGSPLEVLGNIINDPGSGVILTRPRSSTEVERVRGIVNGLLREKPEWLSRALDGGLVVLRVYAHALGGRIPDSEVFLGRFRTRDSMGRHYYRFTLDEVLKALLNL